MMKTINLSKIEHRGVNRIKVSYKRDADFIAKIKTIRGRRWSKTKNCWHLPYSKESFEQLKIVFGEERLVFPKKIKVDDVEKKKEKPIVVLPKKDLDISDPFDPIKSREIFNKIFTVVDEHTPFPVGDFLKKKEKESKTTHEKTNNEASFKTILRYGQKVRVVVGEKIFVEKINEKWLRLFVPFDKKGWIAVVRNIHGRQWNAEKISWKVPYVKQSFWHLKKYVGMEYLEFNFQIEKDIPDEYFSPTPIYPKKNIKKRNGFDQLNEAQKKAIHQLEEKIILLQYSRFTLTSYRNHLIGVFLFFKNILPEKLTSKDIQNYILHKIKFKKISESTQNSIINAVKAYWEKVLKRPKEKIDIPRPKSPKHLPNVFSQEEVVRLIESPKNLKHKLILLLIYSAGLRLSEVINIRTRDINLDRRVIFIKNGKGKKDRFVTLAEEVLPYLKKYNQQYRPNYWLIEGVHGGQYSASSIQKIFQRALQESKVFAYGTIHTLRHSYATHCVENGYSIALLQEALGHASIKTTEKYLHISSKALRTLRSPLDIIKNNNRKQS